MGRGRLGVLVLSCDLNPFPWQKRGKKTTIWANLLRETHLGTSGKEAGAEFGVGAMPLGWEPRSCTPLGGSMD